MAQRVYEDAYASARIFGEHLDPLDVIVALRLPADHTHRHGEPRLRRRRSGVVREYAAYRNGMWSMSSRQHVKSPRLATHIEWLLSEFEPRANTLRTLLSGNVTADFFCYSSGSTDRKPPIPRALRERAHALGFRIEIDHWSSPDEDGDSEDGEGESS